MTTATITTSTDILILALLFICTCAHGEEKLNYTIVEAKAHDPDTFTQGLVMDGDTMYESSGLYGRSFIRSYDEKSNDIRAQRRLSSRLFAEGLALRNKSLYLLTWRAGRLLVFDAKSLEPLRELTYQGEGWGLTHDNRHFIMSDGSDKLYFRNAKTFAVERQISVHNRWRKYRKINELEWAENAIWANVWQAPYILKISPKDGEVLAIINLSELVQNNSTRATDTVLNGIAYDRSRKAFWISGKFWPLRYLVKFHS